MLLEDLATSGIDPICESLGYPPADYFSKTGQKSVDSKANL
jgi:hypothetical protein